MTDGLGLIQLLDLTHGRAPEAEAADPSPIPPPRPVETPTTLLTGRLPALLTGSVGAAARGSVRALGRMAADPVGAVADTVRFGASLQRVLTPPAIERSPALRDGGIGYRMFTHDVPLGRAAEGRGPGRGRHRQRRLPRRAAGCVPPVPRPPRPHMPIAVPVSLRSDNDPLGGNPSQSCDTKSRMLSERADWRPVMPGA